MEAAALEDYLQRHIPLAKAMEIRVVSIAPDAVTLRAPFAPNVNHHETVFGGSAAAAAMLAAWALVHTRLQAAGIDAGVVIRRNTMAFDAPMDADFTVRAVLSRPDAWDEFVQQFASRGIARIDVTAVLGCGEGDAVTFTGEFVALSPGREGR